MLPPEPGIPAPGSRRRLLAWRWLRREGLKVECRLLQQAAATAVYHITLDVVRSEMLWVIVASVALIVAAGCSIAASLDSRRDIAGGQPSFYSDADVTGIWSRAKLDQLLGPRNADDRYTATSEQVDAIPQTLCKRYFDNGVSDLACILLAGVSPFVYGSQTALSLGLLAVSAVYIVTGYVVAVVVVIRAGSGDKPEHPTRQ